MGKKCCQSRPRCKNCPKRRKKKIAASGDGKCCGQRQKTVKLAIG